MCSFEPNLLVLKLHANIVNGILECLRQIFVENKYTEDVLDRIYKKNPQWGSRDRRFIAESTFEIVRWWRFFLYCSGSQLNEQNALQRILAAYLVKTGIDVPIWINDPHLSLDIHSRLNESVPFAIKAAIPDWLDEVGQKELGPSRWESEMNAMNSQAKVFLRSNTLKITAEKLQKLLRDKQVETKIVSTSDDALVLEKRQNLAHLEEYKNGLFEIQDLGSQTIAPFLGAQRGERIIDACAGGGGKTLHIASLMDNNGEIWALDVEEKKLENLKIRAKRAGIGITKTSVIDERFIIEHGGYADKLLLDVPCSGLGVLKRNPDTKWKTTHESIEVIKVLQATILEQYPRMLKVGGEMVYATCSILPSENGGQIERFLKTYGNQYSLLEEKTIWPSEGADGYYMARLRKNS